MIRAAALLLPALLMMADLPAIAAPVPCRTSANLHGACFTVRGRLYVANGAPSVRIWRVGTKRILGVHDGAGSAESDSILPQSIRTLLGDAFGVEVYGNYQVCPLKPEHPGRMQPVCIADWADLVVHRRQTGASGQP